MISRYILMLMLAFAQETHNIYERINPLKKITVNQLNQLNNYWVQVTKFLTNLHETIYTPSHEMHYSKLAVDQYYFLVKMCVDFSFSVPDLITIRNQQDSKACKEIANEIAHNLLPAYILTLQMTIPRPVP